MQSNGSAVSPHKPKLDSAPTIHLQVAACKVQKYECGPRKPFPDGGGAVRRPNCRLRPEAEAESSPLAIALPGPHHNPRLTRPHPASFPGPWAPSPKRRCT